MLKFLLYPVLSFLVVAVHAQVNAPEKYQKVQMGQLVNSEVNEISPLISPDGKTLYFVRVNHPQNTYGNKCKKDICSQDIWYSELMSDGRWSEARRMDEPFNTGEFNSVINISPDGNKLLVRGGFEDGKYEPYSLAISKRNRDGWTIPQKLNIENYDKMNKGMFDGGCFANNDKVLILFFSEKKNDKKVHLYVSFLKDDNVWSQPVDLGKTVNKSNQITPFMASDGVTLYFSSDMDGGLGRNDIYMTRRLDETWLKWTEPQNLGGSINTDGWEGYYSIDAKGEYGYMVSTKNTRGLADIVKIKLKEENKPNPVAYLRGNVSCVSTQEQLRDAEVSFECLNELKNMGGAGTNPSNGEFKLMVPCGKEFGILAMVPGYYPISQYLDLSKDVKYKEVSLNVQMVKIQVGNAVPLTNIFFGEGRSNVRYESFLELNRLAKFMESNEHAVIEIFSPRKEIEKNAELSLNRQKAIVSYLISKGIKESRVVISEQESDGIYADSFHFVIKSL
ncbi:MAG: OmpA family protein [Cytophagaceae bacterium]